MPYPADTQCPIWAIKVVCERNVDFDASPDDCFGGVRNGIEISHIYWARITPDCCIDERVIWMWVEFLKLSEVPAAN